MEYRAVLLSTEVLFPFPKDAADMYPRRDVSVRKRAAFSSAPRASSASSWGGVKAKQKR